MNISGVDATRPIHVLIFEPYPFAQVAGNLRTLLYILAHTDRSKFQLTLAVPFETPLKQLVAAFDVNWQVLPPPAQLNQYGGKVLTGGRWQQLRSVGAWWTYTRYLRRWLRQSQVDVIYCNGIRALITLGVAARLAGVPTVWY
ncbi:MAG: hypothetical protein HQ485_15390, partial [Acidobacteria bacterium]|nr:hypothetical protein [Acidobacteriota bacterium]